jgi:hypothetical protein
VNVAAWASPLKVPETASAPSLLMMTKASLIAELKLNVVFNVAPPKETVPVTLN